MDKNLAIECKEIYKKYPMYHGDYDRLKGMLLPRYKPEEFLALEGINLQVKKGEILGMIGLNGSGKSTLSSIITGITYPSSGSVETDGFAISVHINPDILIIDEALSVGDNSFADKCLNKMNEFKNSGKTIIFVSHAVTQMSDFCDKVMWIHRGRILGIEYPDDIIMPYCGFAREFNAMTVDERNSLTPVLKEYQEKYL